MIRLVWHHHRKNEGLGRNWRKPAGPTEVMVTGLLFLDEQHPNHVAGDDSNHIEIHPVLSIEAVGALPRLGAK